MKSAPTVPLLLEGSFDDIDALASSPMAWDLKYDQIGPGQFQGKLTQMVLGNLQIAREDRSTGVLQQGSAPADTWAFGLPLSAEGPIYIRRRPAPAGQLLAATSRDDIGLTTTGPTAMMIVVIPAQVIDEWFRVRTGVDRVDVHLASPRWQVAEGQISHRAKVLADLLQSLIALPRDVWNDQMIARINAQIADTILTLVPSAEIIEPLHHRARIARDVLAQLLARRDDPPTMTELCMLVGAKERTLHLSCVEAFGRPPLRLLTELRLSAARRDLANPLDEMSVTSVAVRYGFNHLGRFSAFYRNQFGELPSVTLEKVRGGATEFFPA